MGSRPGGLTALYQMGDKLVGYLDEGDYAAAIEKTVWFQSSKSGAATALREIWDGRTVKDIERQKIATALAEVLAYRGEDVSARQALDRWLDKAGRPALDPALPARARLQAAEYLYSLRRFEDAQQVATAIREDCRVRKDLAGQGVAAWHLARCAIRLNNYPQSLRNSDEAIECFSIDTVASDGARRWRTGLALLASGFASWRLGQSTARVKLHLSRTLLAEGRDFLARAHVEHALGTVLRSHGGPDGLADALKAFERARLIYDDSKHGLNLARVHTNIGRTHFDLRKWADATIAFEHALVYSGSIADSGTKNRQRAETLVYSSWLKQRKGDLNAAMADAKDALDAAKDVSTSVSHEALLALGSCLLALNGDLKEAAAHFEAVLHESPSPKVRANAHFWLAERNCQKGGDLTKAIVHWRTATRDKAILESSRYLQKRAQELDDKIRPRLDLFLLERDDLFDRAAAAVRAQQRRERSSRKDKGAERSDRLKELRKRFDRWVFAQLDAEQELFPSLRLKADAMGLSPAGYSKRHKELFRIQFRRLIDATP